jgi:hypothetical protein
MDSPPSASRIKADTIGIGAGPAALGAALALGDSAIVLESRETVGGLCGTVTLDERSSTSAGIRFTHRIPPSVVLYLMPWKWKNRTARWCWLNGEWVHYPFQQHFSELADSDSRHPCRIGLDAAGRWQDAANFDEYRDRRFGPASLSCSCGRIKGSCGLPI